MNEQTETKEQPMEQPVKVNDVSAVAPYPEACTTPTITPQAGCATCGGSEGTTGFSPNGSGTVSYVYAIGRYTTRDRSPMTIAKRPWCDPQGQGISSGTSQDCC